MPSFNLTMETSRSVKCLTSCASEEPQKQAVMIKKDEDDRRCQSNRLGSSLGLQTMSSVNGRQSNRWSSWKGSHQRQSGIHRSINVPHMISTEAGYRRINSMHLSVSSSLYPFGVENEYALHKMSAGRRRWVSVRPPDELGFPVVPHSCATANRVLDFLKPVKPSAYLSEVWSAYFGHLRYRLRQCDFGSPGLSCHPSTNLHETRLTASITRCLSNTKANGIAAITCPATLPVDDLHHPRDRSIIDDGLDKQRRKADGTDHLSAAEPIPIRSNDDGLLKILKLIDIDWKSLSTPACLPVETDFFPDDESLRSDEYIVNDHCVVPIGVTPDEWRQHHDFTREPGLYYCRRPMTVQEVLSEMVRQRLSHGFQLYCDTSRRTASTRLGDAQHCAISPLYRSGAPDEHPLSAKLSGDPQQSTSSSDASTATKVSGRGALVGVRQPTARPSVLRTVSTASPMAARYSLRLRDYTSSRSGALGVTNIDGGGMCGDRLCDSVMSTVSVKREQTPLSSAKCNNEKVCLGASTLTNAVPTIASPFSGQSDGSASCGKVVYRLSCGRTFHTISLLEDAVVVTIHRKQGSQTDRINYRHVIQVPDALGFIVKTTTFAGRSPVSLNWSYLDNYLCTRGVSDSYRLQPTLQFSRSRFLIIPIYSSETKRLMDAIKERSSTGGSGIRCDVFEADYLAMDPMRFSEKFMQFLQGANRIRLVPITSSARKQITRQSSVADKVDSTGHFRPRELNSSSQSDFQSQPIAKLKSGGTLSANLSPTGSIGNTSLLNNLSSNSSAARFQLITNQLCLSSSAAASSTVPASSGLSNNTSNDAAEISAATSATGGSVSASPSVDRNTSHVVSTGNSDSSLLFTPAPTEQTSAASQQSLSMTVTATPLCMAATLMRDPKTGFNFVMPVNAAIFPGFTFLSFDAVVWAIRWLPEVKTVREAVEYFQALLEAGWIRHTSGNPGHRFVYGFHFYTLLCPEIKQWNSNNAGSFDVVTNADSPAAGVAAGSCCANEPVISRMASSTPQPSTPGATTKTMEHHGTATGLNQLCNPAVQPSPFPDAYLPKATPEAGTDGWTLDFQKEWSEVAFTWQRFGRSCPVPLDHYGDLLNSTTIRSACGLKTGSSGFYESENVLRKSHILDLNDHRAAESRVEWAHIVYDANYHPLCGFSIELQWLVASGGRLTDIINQWHHRAVTTDLHFISVPCHPFGQRGPRTDTDPYRSPIWLPVTIAPVWNEETNPGTNTNVDASATMTKALPDAPATCPVASTESGGATAQSDYSSRHVGTRKTEGIHSYSAAHEAAEHLFRNYPENQRILLLRLFQDYILKRFGFLRENCDSYHPVIELRDLSHFHFSEELTNHLVSHNWSYVHCSGGMFAIIPTYKSDAKGYLLGARTACPSADIPVKLENSTTLLRHNEEKRPQTSEHDQINHDCFDDQLETGFFWSWNHMLPKRWRGHLTGDETFQDEVLLDFREFTKAQDGRLEETFNRFMRNIPPLQ